MPANEDRIAQLSQRFKTHAVGRRPQSTPRTRERHSLYLDTDLVAQATAAYKDLSHQLYPKTLSKSLFWETLLSFGLARLPEIKELLAEQSASSDNRDV